HLENVINRTQAIVESRTVVGHSPAPLGVKRTEQSGLIKIIKEEPAGQLEAYLCGSCGFYETYVKDPTSLDFESIEGFKWIQVDNKDH
ncbi:MAG: hypothetical protein ACK2TZ_12825, partial [Anaerolineales bacterium]